MNAIKSWWWKILGMVLLIYGFSAGLLLPLKTGITDATPFTAELGQKLELNSSGYNTYYTQSSDHRAWLKLGDYSIAANAIQVNSDQALTLEFDLPTTLPPGIEERSATLIIDNIKDGTHLLPGAVYLNDLKDSIASTNGTWEENAITSLNKQEGITFPYRNTLYETIRNTYFHVSLWFAMIIIFIAGMVNSIKYLRKKDMLHDHKASAFTSVGILFGILGLLTGAVWAKHTWGAYWSWDIKQNMTAISLLIYLAYFVLRSSIPDVDKKARLSAVYNIFAFAALIPLIYVIPRLFSSLHPGNGGNPAFGSQDLDNTMRMVFYPIIIGWTLFGWWMATIKFRTSALNEKVN
jgi:heme exporter protein C